MCCWKCSGSFSAGFSRTRDSWEPMAGKRETQAVDLLTCDTLFTAGIMMATVEQTEMPHDVVRRCFSHYYIALDSYVIGSPKEPVGILF